MNTATAIEKSTEKEMLFVPYGAVDKIRLTVSIIQNIVAVPTKSGKTCSERDALKFMMLCQAQRLNPFAGDAFLVGYDGQNGATFSLITAHQAFLKRAETSEDFDGMVSGVLVRGENDTIIEREGDFHLRDELENIVGGWARVFHKKRSHPTSRKIRMERFNNGFAQWKVDAAGMIVKCFDEETEVLTDRGFEKFATAEGAILQVTANGLQAVDAVPFVQKYDGPMIRLESDDLNFCVTPNHDMITDKGRVEAGIVFDLSRSRPQFCIPRIVEGTKPDANISDAAISLAAAYLCDGSDKPDCSFWIGVSRPHKIQRLMSLGLHHAKHGRKCFGDAVKASSGRTITTQADKTMFGFKYELIEKLVGRGKKIDIAMLLSLSKRQALIFADSLMVFDGSTNTLTGVHRFYSSNLDIVRAFEIACVAAGYAVSNRKSRTSDISTKPNICLTASGRNTIPVRKWGSDARTGLVKQLNATDKVWCVTVPTGVIVVRRHGFSMICGNCAEADALRSTFPTLLGGLYMKEELEASVAAVIPSTVASVESQATVVQVEAAGKSSKPTPQSELETLIVTAGFTFTDLQRFGTQSGNIENADSMASFAEVPTDTARRLLRASVGLLKSLADAKGGK